MGRSPLKESVLAFVKTEDQDLLKKGIAKFDRWMRAAYGYSDWASAIGEMGANGCAESIDGYAAESRTGNTTQTFNHATARNRATNRMSK